VRPFVLFFSAVFLLVHAAAVTPALVFLSPIRRRTMRSYRKCAEPGCETYFPPKSSRNRFCLRHRKTKPVDPEHYRKYGTAHRRLRKQSARKVQRGDVECWRCGEPIDLRDAWDLDHVDGGGPPWTITARRTPAATVRRIADLNLLRGIPARGSGERPLTRSTPCTDESRRRSPSSPPSG
jgi:hypothetical protein